MRGNNIHAVVTFLRCNLDVQQRPFMDLANIFYRTFDDIRLT